jgi:hypothetical protein
VLYIPHAHARDTRLVVCEGFVVEGATLGPLQHLEDGAVS